MAAGQDLEGQLELDRDDGERERRSLSAMVSRRQEGDRWLGKLPWWSCVMRGG
jgi:hypothetical protein